MNLALSFIFSIAIQLAAADDSILFIGDSHSVMTFGQTFARRLGPSVKRYAVAGTTAKDWLRPKICPVDKPCEFTYGYSTPNGDFDGTVPPDFEGLDQLLKKTPTSQVVIALGTNDADQRCHRKLHSQFRQIKTLLRHIEDRTCFWIGPPVYKRGPVFQSCGSAYELFVSHMKAVIESRRCKYIDSRKILDPISHLPIEADLEDELHFGDRLGQVWGEAAADEVIRR